MSNLASLKESYKNFAEGNIDGVVSLWKDDIKWMASEGFPYWADGHTFIGKQTVVENVFSKIPEFYTDFNIVVERFITEGDSIVMVGHYTGVWKDSGKPFKANAMHFWTFENEMVASYYQAVDTAVIINS